MSTVNRPPAAREAHRRKLRAQAAERARQHHPGDYIREWVKRQARENVYTGEAATTVRSNAS